MNPLSALAIYFIIWWLVLFLVLPWGIRSAHEAGLEIEEGHEPGAPAVSYLGRKLMMTTLIACVVFGLFYMGRDRGWFSWQDLPFYSTMPKPTA